MPFPAICLALTIVTSILVALRLLPLGLEDWVWKYSNVSLWDRAWLPAAVFLLLAALLKTVTARLDKMSRRDEVVVVVMLVVFACALQFSTAYLGKGGFQDAVLATVMPHVSGYHAAAYNVSDARLFLAHYADYIAQINMRSSLMHVAQHPPGPVLYYWSHDQFFRRFPGLGSRVATAIEKRLPGAGNAFEELNLALDPPRRAAIWTSAFRLFILAGLAVLPTYLLARALHGPSVALWAAGFCGLIPSLHLFSPYFDQCYALFAVILYWLSLLALRRQS
ncbi:MAG: hypothetical protein FJ272_11490, partial [Planctomycetes bacterium]|nr:hypothetical protein [Planctomycetota bacterium]